MRYNECTISIVACAPLPVQSTPFRQEVPWVASYRHLTLLSYQLAFKSKSRLIWPSTPCGSHGYVFATPPCFIPSLSMYMYAAFTCLSYVIFIVIYESRARHHQEIADTSYRSLQIHRSISQNHLFQLIRQIRFCSPIVRLQARYARGRCRIVLSRALPKRA